MPACMLAPYTYKPACTRTSCTKSMHACTAPTVMHCPSSCKIPGHVSGLLPVSDRVRLASPDGFVRSYSLAVRVVCIHAKEPAVDPNAETTPDWLTSLGSSKPELSWFVHGEAGFTTCCLFLPIPGNVQMRVRCTGCSLTCCAALMFCMHRRRMHVYMLGAALGTRCTMHADSLRVHHI